MRATEEAAFWLYSAKDWIDGMNAFVPDRLKAYARSYHLLYIRTQMKK